MRYIFLILLFSIYSCKDAKSINEEKLMGQWAIYEMVYKGIDYKNDLIINYMTFEEDFSTHIPETTHFENNYDSTWSLTSWENEPKVQIKSNNPVFNGVYTVRYIKDKKEKLLGIELKSQNTYMKAFKLLQNFDIDGRDW